MTSLEQQLVEMDSFIAMDDVLNGITLHPKQCIDILKMLAIKKSIVIYDTGTGKTLLAAAFMKMLLKEDPTRRFIFFCTKDQLIQTPKKLESLTGFPVLVSDANEKSVVNNILTQDIYKYRIIMLTHDCILKRAVLDKLYSIREDITGIIIDEAHKLNNTSYAKTSEILKAVVSKFEFTVALTATPIRTDLKQLTKLANLVNASRYPNPKKLMNELDSGKYSLDKDPCFFINRSASELGRVAKPQGYVAWCSPLAHQKAETRGGVALMQTCKGEGAVPQVEKLIELIKHHKGEKGLVFISEGVIYDWVISNLNKTDIKYEIIQGVTPTWKRAEIMEAFNNEDDTSIDVVLTSVTTAVDLDCSYVIFYEFTVDVEQMIGRSHRGLGNKQVSVYFIITRGTKEVEYFVNNILERCELIMKILGKENNAVKQIGEEIGARS